MRMLEARSLFGGLTALTLLFPGQLRSAGFQVVLFAYTLVVFDARKIFYACCVFHGVVGTWILLLC
jgi:hypothetical protein